MHIRRWWLLLCLLCPAVTVQSEETQPVYETQVFVGRLISIEEQPDPCESKPVDADRMCIAFDALYLAKYEVVRPVLGEMRSKEIDIRVADHYGFPKFARHPYALLFVAVGADDAYLHKYQGFPVYRTVSGDWASCGDPADWDSDHGTPRPVAITFAEDFGLAKGRKKRMSGLLFSEADLVVKSGKVRCVRGQPLAAIYETERNGVMKARDVELPHWDEIDSPAGREVSEEYRLNLGGEAGYFTDWERMGLIGFSGLTATVYVDDVYGEKTEKWDSIGRINLLGAGNANDRRRLSFFFHVDRGTRRVTSQYRMDEGQTMRLDVPFRIKEAIPFSIKRKSTQILEVSAGGIVYEVPCDFEVAAVQVVGSGVHVRFEPFVLKRME
jgi:hypothetical protein